MIGWNPRSFARHLQTSGIETQYTMPIPRALEQSGVKDKIALFKTRFALFLVIFLYLIFYEEKL